MEDFVVNSGYLGLFAVSFLAATLLPLSSEGCVGVLVGFGCNPWFVFVVATAGNFLGALTNYYMGRWGGEFLFCRFIRMKPETLGKAKARYERWGAPILVFSWVPVIGDPLTVIAGALKGNLYAFTFWVLLGKGARYVFVIWASVKVLG